jgi:preprotein translocase subunit Sss1
VFVPTLILKTDQPIDIVSNNISLALLILCGIVCSHQFIIMVKKPNSYKTFDIIIAFFAAFFLIGAIGYYSL